MRHDTQIALIRRIFAYLDSGTTTMAPAVHRNPVSDYTCARQHRAEQEMLFRRRPLVIGLSGDLRNAGDYLTDDNGQTPLLVVRQADGGLRAFVNSCRHRGSRVADGRGSLRGAFTCPFHGWSYAADGSVAGIPGQVGFAGEDRSCLGLLSVPVAERHGLIWCRPAGDEEIEPDELLGGAAGDLSMLNVGGFHHHRTERRRVRMNWKLVVDTFLETYHFPVLHRDSVNSIFFPNCGPFDGYGPNLRLIGVRRTIDALRGTPEGQWSLLPHATIVYLLFPNTVLIYQAGHLELWRIFPAQHLDADPVTESQFSISLYAPEEPRSDRAKAHWDANLDLLLDVTMNEDFANGAATQSGFASNRLSDLLFGRNEPALIHFHKAVQTALNA